MDPSPIVSGTLGRTSFGRTSFGRTPDAHGQARMLNVAKVLIRAWCLPCLSTLESCEIRIDGT